ncbi:MAG: SRPBCC family protein [Actinobacteria bacterium]|nr:SRPBCC family protein [Actinomycetota bacterium]
MTDRSILHASFTVERTYPFPPATVFRAWADEGQKAAWFHGPPDFGQEGKSFDFRVGGSETVATVPPGEKAHRFTCRYYDIVDDERIVYAYNMEHGDERASLSVATIELEAVDGGTKVTVTEQGVFLDDIYDADDRQHGTIGLLGQLGEHLASQAAQPA